MPTLAQLLEARTVATAPELLETLDKGRLRCHACGHQCPVPDGSPGVCKVRFNRNGTLQVPWGYVGGVQCDPMRRNNLPGRVGDLENTRCHACGALLVERHGYFVQQYRLTSTTGAGPDCHTSITGQWGAAFEGLITGRPFLPGTRRLRTF